MIQSVRPRTNAKKVGWAALLALLVIVVTACGARIDTVLDISEDGSGSREMTATLPADQRQNFTATPEQIDESVNRHIPSALEFSGAEENGDGDIVMVFTLDFDSVEDYRAKVQEVLRAGDIAWNDEMLEVVRGNGPFRTGITFRERYGSLELLQWLREGVIADGLIDASNRGNVFEVGTTVVDYEGVRHESGANVSLDQLEDKGFNAVQMSTRLNPEGADRDIALTLSQKALYNSSPELYDDYFSALEGEGVEVSKDDADQGITWTASFSAATDAEVAAMTDRVLGSEESSFTRELTMRTDGRVEEVLSISQFAECSTICNGMAQAQVSDQVVPTPEFRDEAAGTEEGRFLSFWDSAEEVSFSRTFMLESGAAALSVEKDGPASWIGTFTLPEADADKVRDAFVEALSTDGFPATAVDGSNDISIEVAGDSLSAFNQRYSAWNDSNAHSGIDMFDVEDGDHKGSTAVNGVLPLPHHVASHLDGAVHHTLEFDGFGDIDAESPYNPASMEVDGSTATGELPDGMFSFLLAPSSGGWLMPVIGALAVMAVGAGVIVWLLRRSKQPRGAAPGQPA